MADASHIVEATAENFARLVLQNSDKGPVLVNYWSPRAGPCMMMLPRLIRLTQEFGGRFLLATLNTDEHGTFARSQGVNSIPTVKVYRHGRVIDTLHGAESEPSLRRFIQKHVTDVAQVHYAAAIEAHRRGDTEHAIRLAAEAALADPENLKIPLDLAKLLVLQRRYAQADDLLESLPAEAKEREEIRNLLVHVGFLRAAETAPPHEVLTRNIAASPDDLDSRHRLAAVCVTRDDYDGAMEQLPEIAQRDRNFRHDVGRRGLLALFALLGEDDARTQRYRARLAELNG